MESTKRKYFNAIIRHGAYASLVYAIDPSLKIFTKEIKWGDLLKSWVIGGSFLFTWVMIATKFQYNKVHHFIEGNATQNAALIGAIALGSAVVLVSLVSIVITLSIMLPALKLTANEKSGSSKDKGKNAQMNKIIDILLGIIGITSVVVAAPVTIPATTIGAIRECCATNAPQNSTAKK